VGVKGLQEQEVSLKLKIHFIRRSTDFHAGSDLFLGEPRNGTQSDLFSPSFKNLNYLLSLLNWKSLPLSKGHPK
jgi:hypothetical protein